jgi:hypothetical protein
MPAPEHRLELRGYSALKSHDQARESSLGVTC